MVDTKFTKWSNFVREAWLIEEKWNKRSCLKPPMNADAGRCSAPLIGVDRRASAVPYPRRYEVCSLSLAVEPRLRREVPKRPAAGAIGSSPAGSALLQGKRVHVTALRSLKSSMYHACGPKYSAACNSSKVSAGGPILARRLASASARLLRSSGISSWV